MEPNPVNPTQMQTENSHTEKKPVELVKTKTFFHFNKKFLPITLFVILGLILVVSLSFAGYYYLGKNGAVNNNASLPVPTFSTGVTPTVSTQQSAHPAPGIIKGTIQWTPSVEEISQTPALSLVRELTLTSRGLSNFNITSIKYYKVGTWLTGEYKGKDVIDAVVSILFKSEYPGAPDTTTNEYIIRVMEDGGKLILFENSSSLAVASFHDDSSHKMPEGIIVDQRKLPDLFYSYPVYKTASNGGDENVLFPITYLGKTKQFQFLNDAQIQDQFFTEAKPGYKMLTTFSYGQKLFGRDPSINPVAWSAIVGNPYYVEDLDHSFISIDYSTFASNNFSKNITWIKQPDLLADISGYHQQYDPVAKSASDITYSDLGFVEGCTFIPTDKMAADSKFDSSQLELVATSDTHQIYRPTNADNIIHFMYDYVSKNLPSLSYERYANSFPLLVYKDAFGTYQLMVRMDYPGHPQGCGKPVIYLYPTQKTDVKVSFSSQMNLIKTEPIYQNGWNVTAYPDGEIINKSDGKTYPYLFWEGATSKSFPDLNYGNVVKKEDVKDFFSKQLGTYGLNKKESNDFMDYWIPYLTKKPYYLISFYTTNELNNTIPEFISPKPDSVLRILMQYKGLDNPIAVNPPPTPVSFQRNGFTVIEWGGIYGD